MSSCLCQASLSLLQQQALLSASGLAALDLSPLNDASAAAASMPDLSWLIDFLAAVNLDDLSEADANVTYFVSGYIGRSICRRRRCSACKDLLVANEETPQLHKSVPEEHAQPFEMADRGGLSTPTEFCFATTCVAVQHYTAIMLDEATKLKLLAVKNQRSAFTSAISHVVMSQSFGRLLEQRCSAGHFNFKMIVESAFNCFAKNELKRLNSSKDAPPQLSSGRKIRKLNAKSSNKNSA